MTSYNGYNESASWATKIIAVISHNSHDRNNYNKDCNDIIN